MNCYMCDADLPDGAPHCEGCMRRVCEDCDGVFWHNQGNGMCGACLNWPMTNTGLGGFFGHYVFDSESWWKYARTVLKAKADELGWTPVEGVEEHDEECWIYDDLTAQSDDGTYDRWFPNPVEWDVVITDTRNPSRGVRCFWDDFIAQTAQEWRELIDTMAI